MMSGIRDDNHNYFNGNEPIRGILYEQRDSESKHGFWKCSVCTYDNDDNLSSCYICGAFRNSYNGFEIKDDDQALPIQENSTSVMAKALFVGMAHQNAKNSGFSDVLLRKEANSCEIRANTSSDNFQETFLASNNKHSVSIVPFRFDTLSPDDIVSQGRMKPKGMPVSALPRCSDKKEIVKIMPECEEETEISSTQSPHLNETRSNNSNRNDNESKILVSKLQPLKLEKGIKNIKKVLTLDQYRPEKWVLSEQEQEIMSQLSIAIVGHVDSGKSTLSGRLLHLLGRISKKEMHKYQKDAKAMGKGSFAFAWAMDETTEERERGVTMTVAVAFFESKKYRVVLLDSPGHRDFVPNMISGATQADAAILVVDASNGSFEAGMGIGDVGQTKEHAQLIRSFGVEQIIVAVNKMDTVGYSQERFDYIKLQMASFLRSCGFKETLITWIPLSAMENQNLLTLASDDQLFWYRGHCLLDAIDSLSLPERDVLKPPFLPIGDVLSSHSLGQVVACGKLEAGAIRLGFKVLVMPCGDLATVRSIERDSQPCVSARAGDHIAITLQGIDGANLVPGGVLCHPDFPVSVASILELKILVMEIKTPILVGSHVEFHIHHAKEVARVTKILSLVDQKKGKSSKSTPRLLTSRQSAIIEVSLDRPVCVEIFSSCRILGRAFLRAHGITIAVGIVTRIIADDENSSIF